MSDPTTYPTAPTPPIQPDVRSGTFTGPPVATPKPIAPPPAPKEPTIKDRASGLLATMTDAQRHNAPITPWMLTELAAVVGQVTGNKAPVYQHVVTDARGIADQYVFRKPDGSVGIVTSAEEALAYVRSLPKDVQARPHWVAADNALVEAIASIPGTDVSPALRQFCTALAEDRKLDAKPVDIKDKPADDTKMEAQRQAQAKATADHDAWLKTQQPAPAPVS